MRSGKSDGCVTVQTICTLQQVDRVHALVTPLPQQPLWDHSFSGMLPFLTVSINAKHDWFYKAMTFQRRTDQADKTHF
jgi:hypothetical protein